MLPAPSDAPVLPIVILALDNFPALQPRREAPPALRHWHIETFLCQTSKADQTQRTYHYLEERHTWQHR